MTNQHAGGNDAGAVTSSPQAEDHDVAAAICGEESHTETKQEESHTETEKSVSRSKQPGRFKRLWRWINRQPPWWVSQILVAGLVGVVVGGLILVSGNRFNDLQARHALQLENLRFVRDRAATNPNKPFPFGRLDLEGQDLSFLPLARADFNNAKLDRAQLLGSVLTHADFGYASLRSADVSGARLDGASLWRADLTGADFRYADLSFSELGAADLKGADLTGAKLDHIHYNQQTKWPDGFRPPPSEELDPDNVPGPGPGVAWLNEPPSSQPSKP
jgi:hypothetical protein